MELSHGPTCAFKDMALQLLPRLMVASKRKLGDDRRVCILAATSGDTGKAALEGFRDVEGTQCVVFYPHDGVSPTQRLQMVTQRGNNVDVVAVRGNFDDTQRGVKRIFGDAEAKARVEAVGVIRLAQRKTLVQQLYCIETLARVDTLCLDKTGTITTGEMQVSDLVAIDAPYEFAVDALRAFTSVMTDDNPTSLALKKRFEGGTDWTLKRIEPFSSARKWSGAEFERCGSIIVGAPEFVLGEDYARVKAQVEDFAAHGQRVLVLAQADAPFGDRALPAGSAIPHERRSHRAQGVVLNRKVGAQHAVLVRVVERSPERFAPAFAQLPDQIVASVFQQVLIIRDILVSIQAFHAAVLEYRHGLPAPVIRPQSDNHGRKQHIY